MVVMLEQDAHQLVGQANRRATKIRPKAVGSSIFGCFPSFDKCRSEVAGDVISSVAVEYIGMDVRVTFGESGLNSGRIIGLFEGPYPFYARSCPVFNCILQPTRSN